MRITKQWEDKYGVVIQLEMSNGDTFTIREAYSKEPCNRVLSITSDIDIQSQDSWVAVGDFEKVYDRCVLIGRKDE